MMTIDIDTISGVPLTGELKMARPNTSAQTRKPSRKMITAAAASNPRTILAFRSSSTCPPPGGKQRTTDCGRPLPSFECYLIL
jgi:hypothetical protein